MKNNMAFFDRTTYASILGTFGTFLTDWFTTFNFYDAMQLVFIIVSVALALVNIRYKLALTKSLKKK